MNSHAEINLGTQVSGPSSFISHPIHTVTTAPPTDVIRRGARPLSGCPTPTFPGQPPISTLYLSLSADTTQPLSCLRSLTLTNPSAQSIPPCFFCPRGSYSSLQAQLTVLLEDELCEWHSLTIPTDCSACSDHSSVCIPRVLWSGLVSTCLAAGFLRAGPRLIYSPPLTASVILQVLTDNLGNDPDLVSFPGHLLFLFLKICTHSMLPEDSTCHPGEEVKHIWWGVPVIQVFTCEFLNIEGSQGRQKLSS